MAEGGGVDKLSLDNELSDSILDEDDDDGRIDEELLEYLLTQIPAKKRKAAKHVVTYTRMARVSIFQISYGLTATMTIYM